MTDYTTMRFQSSFPRAETGGSVSPVSAVSVLFCFLPFNGLPPSKLLRTSR